MTDLTLALSIAGGLVLAGVIAHGAWQARRASPKRPVVEPQSAGADLREPVMDGSSDAPGADAALAHPLSDEPRLVIPRRATARLDALIDAIATLQVDAPISGDLVVLHLPPTRRAGSKPFGIEGMNADTGEWEVPVAGARYREFQAGVQLANRTGALNEIEYSEFVQKVQAFADVIGASPDFPDMLDIVARARELDAFAGQYDAQLAVRLHTRTVAWSLGYVQQQASRHGFVVGPVPGRLVMPSVDESAPPVLTLSFDPQAALAEDPNLSSVSDVTLSFDVPQTDPAIDPFAAWQASAQALALTLDAMIVDDNGRPLEPAGFDSIGGELTQLYGALAERDLAAGSLAARRLFS